MKNLFLLRNVYLVPDIVFKGKKKGRIGAQFPRIVSLQTKQDRDRCSKPAFNEVFHISIIYFFYGLRDSDYFMRI